MSARALFPRRPWRGRRIVLGVTGGISAYKSVQLARDLTQLGAEVDTVLTSAAQRFIEPLSFSGVTGRPALTDLFSEEGAALHIRLGLEADVVCVAPATADFIARAAHGLAGDLLATTLLATRAPVVLCPAMNDRMFAHAQTQANLRHAQHELGYRIAGPGIGPLAVGEGEGPGRMLEPPDILEHVGRALAADGPLVGRRVLITAGPTREGIDPVRYLGNRSSGRMGFALARVAWRRGAEVEMVTGPASLHDPIGVAVVRVETAQEMLDRVREGIPDADVVVFAAAVSDFRPETTWEGKLKRREQGGELRIALTENPDIARETRELRKPGAVAVGFALESEKLVENARRKLEEKAFSFVVANSATEVDAGFEADTNRVSILPSSGEVEELPLLHKEEVAEEILDRVEALLEAGG